MNNLVLSQNVISSVDLVKLINAVRLAERTPDEFIPVSLRHDNFITKIELVLKYDALNFKGVYIGGNGEERLCYYLPKREATLMVMSESYAVQARVYDRMAELEATNIQFIIPTTLSGALRLAAEQAEMIEAQALQLEAAKPSINFVEQFVDTNSTKGFRQTCKLLGINENEFRTFLESKKIMYRLDGEWMPYQNHVDAGRMVVRQGISGKHAFTSGRFTTKGIIWLSGEFAKFNLDVNMEND
jgi:phage antirepressor YoqD-like protein